MILLIAKRLFNIAKFGNICEIETEYFPETEITNGTYIVWLELDNENKAYDIPNILKL